MKGKVVVITGASKGYGMEAAFGFAREGADLALCARGYEKLKETAHKIETETGRRVLAVKTDITKKDDVANFFDQAVETFGKIDVLVNNAGMYPPSSLVDMSEELMDQVFSLNIKGAFLCAQAAAKQMIKQNGGKIVNVGSAAGRRGFGYQLSHYAASKGAMIAATRDWAMELGAHGITVNCVAFGTFPDKEVRKQFGDAFFEGVAAITMMKRLGEPKDIVPILIFLASDECEYMTGETISYDGGSTWS